MSLLILILAISSSVGICDSCSLPQGYESKSIAELTRLAPLVLHAKVVATNNKTMNENDYNATLNYTMFTHVYKGELNLTQIEVTGFATSASCRSV